MVIAIKGIGESAKDLNLKLNDYESCALPIKLLTLNVDSH